MPDVTPDLTPNLTPNLNLEKPVRRAQYNVDLWNNNMDKIDYNAGLVPPKAIVSEKFEIGRKINNVLFDGSQDITIDVGIADAPSDDKMYGRKNGVWATIASETAAEPPNNITNFTITSANKSNTLKWTDPADGAVSGEYVTWAGTKIIRKVGGYPTSEVDGTLVVISNIRNEYQTTGFLDSGLTNNTTYYYQAFPYSTRGAINRNTANRANGTPVETPPGNVTSLSGTVGNQRIILKWTDPTTSSWVGTIIRVKTGSYPTDENDGTLVINSKTKNQYQTNGYTYSGLTNGTTYYFQAFPYTADGSTNRNTANRTTGTPKEVPTGNITTFAATSGINSITLTWTDPTDSFWASTKIMRKLGDYPANENDGTLVITNTTKNQYKTTGFLDSGVVSGNTYYYQAFPIAADGSVNRNVANRLTAVPQAPYRIFGVAIDLTNSNPSTSVTYTDDAIGMVGGSVSWDSQVIFKDIKPCMLKNGVVQYYLNPDNFAQKANTTAADITDGNDGDVMIQIPKFATSIVTNGDYLYVKITDNPNPTNGANENWTFNAYTRSTQGDRNNLYIGAYLSSNIYSGSWGADPKPLRSLNDKSLNVDIHDDNLGVSMDEFRTLAKKNGAGYDLISFYAVTALQCLYIIRYKNLNGQSAIGYGYIAGGAAPTNTGGANAKGMNFGGSKTTQMKFLGIEDFWGNKRWFVDGVITDASRNIFTAFQNFNDTGSGYTNRGKAAATDINGYMKKPQGINEMGFIIKEAGGSQTTYFADQVRLKSGRVGNFGCAHNSSGSGDVVGSAFSLELNETSSRGSQCVGRLMYL